MAHIRRSKKWRHPWKGEDLKNVVELKNEDNLKNEDDLINEDNIKMNTFNIVGGIVYYLKNRK